MCFMCTPGAVLLAGGTRISRLSRSLAVSPTDAQLAANQNRPDKFVPIYFDEAGHRVATQYLLSALDGAITFPHLKNYRVGHAGLPGHPELHCTPGVKFSSGRLGQVP